MFKTFTISIFIAITLVSSGCFELFKSRGVAEEVDSKDPTLSLVYGYADFSELRSLDLFSRGMDWFQVAQYLPEPRRYRNCGYVYDDKIFYHPGVPNGSYQFARAGYSEQNQTGPNSFSVTEVTYSLESAGANPSAIRIKDRGAYYMGSYKILRDPNNETKLQMIEMKSPGEKQVLEILMEKVFKGDEEDYVQQIELVKKRLAELK